ncbi:MAG: hypothetical protein WD534_09115 [Phycisphaeraceae bacterium]
MLKLQMIYASILVTLALTVGSLHCAAQTIEPKPEPVDPASIPERDYLVVQDGQLWSDGQRQRYWAVIGKLYPSSGVQDGDSPEQVAEKVRLQREGTDLLLDRFEDLGFNAMRLWAGFSDPDARFTPGDGSGMDSANYFIARAGQRGFRIWMAGLNAVGQARPEDVDVIDDPDTVAAWQAAIEDAGGAMNLRNNPARIWDERLEALAIERMQTAANQYNPYTGLRWADDPTLGIWELSNEEWWVSRMVGGSWQNLPAFFRNQLIARWNGFLRDKYSDDAALAAAWDGLLPGESLAQETVLLAPMTGTTDAQVSINDAGAHAVAALEALEQAYSRDDFAEQRGRDVLEFFTGLIVTHKQREAAAIKPLGRSTRLSPMIYDTGIGYRIQEQYLHQHADAVAHDAYINGMGNDRWDRVDEAEDELGRMLAELEAMAVEPNENRWINWLLKPPGIAQGVPWLEHNKAPGMPYLVYETQIQQPAKYRADFPLRLAALASIQDWDWVCWHYFGDGSLDAIASTERPFERPMDITTGGHPQGYHYTYDQVQSATLRAAGHLFRNRLLEPTEHPTVFMYGRDKLYDPDSMPYGRSYGTLGMNMLGTVYEHGVRLWIDPNLPTSTVVGPQVTYEDRKTHNPYQPTDQITFDWEAGILRFDAPGAAAFAGLMSNVGDTLRFDAGDVTLRDVHIANDEGIYEPIEADHKYIAFALHSHDGQPLSEAQHVSLSLVSTSFNSGFAIGNDEQPTQRGELPVLHARVAGTIEAPAIDGMRYTFYDWHLQPIGSGVVENGVLHVPNDTEQPIFVIELQR